LTCGGGGGGSSPPLPVVVPVAVVISGGRIIVVAHAVVIGVGIAIGVGIGVAPPVVVVIVVIVLLPPVVHVIVIVQHLLDVVVVGSPRRARPAAAAAVIAVIAVVPQPHAGRQDDHDESDDEYPDRAVLDVPTVPLGYPAAHGTRGPEGGVVGSPVDMIVEAGGRGRQRFIFAAPRRGVGRRRDGKDRRRHAATGVRAGVDVDADVGVVHREGDALVAARLLPYGLLLEGVVASPGWLLR